MYGIVGAPTSRLWGASDHLAPALSICSRYVSLHLPGVTVATIKQFLQFMFSA